jgi:hypothetical protein
MDAAERPQKSGDVSRSLNMRKKNDRRDYRKTNQSKATLFGLKSKWMNPAEVNIGQLYLSRKIAPCPTRSCPGAIPQPLVNIKISL